MRRSGGVVTAADFRGEGRGLSPTALRYFLGCLWPTENSKSMSYCKEAGKDQVIFATKEDLSEPSRAIINVDDDDEDQPPGLILPNGDINWDCPCLGGMATGPCGTEFREAFSCFHYSEAQPKGSDCYEGFLKMQNCMSEYPELYPPSKPSETEEDPLLLPEVEEDDNDKESIGLINVLSSNSEEETSETADSKS